MARATWTGALTFGLVTVPVSMFSATEDHTTRFRQIQRGTADRVRIRRTNERTGDEVPFNEIVKGYDLGDDQYVVIEPSELDEIAPGRSRLIEVSGFVDLAAVDPVYFVSGYFLAPRGEEFTQVYSLLVEALEESGRAAVATMVMRGRQYLTAIRPTGDVLELHTLHWADEVRDPAEELPNPPVRTRVSAEQLSAAKQLIEAMSVEWTPTEYRDDYEDRVRELIDAKRAGQEIVTAEAAPEATNVIDLMEALRRSLDRSAGAPAAEAAPAGRSKATAAKRRSPKAVSTARKKEDLGALSKAELYQRAAGLDLPGRSKMTRDQLERAIAKAASANRPKAVA
ncbi:Ku protein [Streptacidiphilus sp. N1-10]|uniref:Non-homologous end joining protein Ku n=1 Tax=Streptacidiphilus jeojiensis TaxID=3229225 RepID=A0ABV6XR17_9ACTN